MNGEVWRRVEEILDQALEVPEDERAALVEEATEGEPDLRAEVERMLRACAASEGLLATPPPIVARDVLTHPPEDFQELAPGTIVGQYRIVEHLGRGGMGSVFLAERSDGAFEKQVALKVVQRTVASADTLRRFEDERRILARLEHPNITGILDGGITDDGLPYFVMDLARGDPIDVHCDRLRLGIDPRVELFRIVCDAVQYAHGNLVVHRDLKPSNILVDPSGAVQLLDFGIAKVLDERGGDAEPQTIGPTQRLTPEYAAPEQITGEPTTAATDVYALGAVLYELLVGERPYEIPDRSIAGIARAVCLSEPRSPAARVREAGDLAARAAELRSTSVAGLASGLEGDLDAVVLKALEKSPALRYGSAAEFSADLRRYIEGRPIHARPNTRWYRTGKFLRRYRMQVLTTTAAVALLVAGVVTTTVQWRNAVRERERAELTESFLITTLQEAAPERQGGTTIESGDFIRRGITNLAHLEGTTDLRASVMNMLGQVSLDLSEFDLADSLFTGALEILGEDDDTEAVLARAESMTGLGYRYLRGTGQITEAVDWFERALSLRRSVLEPGDSLISRSLTDVGFARYAARENEAAASDLQAALSLEPPPYQRVRTLEFLANTFARLAAGMAEAGDAAGATDALTTARAFGEEAFLLAEAEFGPGTARVADVLLSLTEVAIFQGRAAEAQRYAEQALAIMLAVYGEGSPRTAIAHSWVARAASEAGDLNAAEVAFELAWETFEAANPDWTWRARLGLAGVLIRQGRFEEAETLLETTLENASGGEIGEEAASAISLSDSLYTAWGLPARAVDYEARMRALIGVAPGDTALAPGS